MDFKQKYLEGNNFIFSPRGKISRTRYFIYAFLLEILYRLLLASGMALSKEVSPILFVLSFLIIPIIILKMFNYKKRACSFLNNDFFAYLYTIIYMLIGGIIAEYTHLLKLSSNKALYELTNNSNFQQYANVYIPDFINSNICSILFYILCGIGMLMFSLLIFYPEKKSDQINDNVKNIKNHSKLNVKNKIIALLTFIIYMISGYVSYEMINTKAYNGLTYQMTKQQAVIVNEFIKKEYDEALNKYNKQLEYEYAGLFAEKCPQKPFYFGEKYDKIKDNAFNALRAENILAMYEDKGSSYFYQITKTHDSFSIFKSKWGDIEFNEDNQFFFDNNGRFFPKKNLIILWLLLLPMSIVLSKIFVHVCLIIIKHIKPIKSIKFNIKPIKNKKSNLSIKLQELNALKEQGLITEEDYNNKKSQLLDEY